MPELAMYGDVDSAMLQSVQAGTIREGPLHSFEHLANSKKPSLLDIHHGYYPSPAMDLV